MIIVTTDGVPGYRIEEVLGEVVGLLAQSSLQYGGTLNWSTAYRGGEDVDYTQLLHHGRNEAMNRLWVSAQEIGANAIAGMRYDVSTITESLWEVSAYGTAVLLRPLAEGETGATEQSIKQAAESGGGPAAPQQPPPRQRNAPAWLPQRRPPQPPPPGPPPGPGTGHQAPPPGSVPPPQPGSWPTPPPTGFR